MHLHRAPRQFRSAAVRRFVFFFCAFYKRRRYIPGIQISARKARASKPYSSKCGMRAVIGGIYRNNSASVHAQAYARPNTRRYRYRTVNHREITGVYGGNYYISPGEMYLFLDTLRLPSQVNRSTRCSIYNDTTRLDVRLHVCLLLLRSTQFT